MLHRVRKWRGGCKRPMGPVLLTFQINVKATTTEDVQEISEEGRDSFEEFRSGDREAFSKAYIKFRGPILNYVMSKLRDREIAEEITQDVFIKSYRFRDSYDPKFEFSTWLWTIARNTLSDWFRKNRDLPILNGEAMAEKFDLNEIPALTPDPEHMLIEAMEKVNLMKMMNALTDLQKKVFFMRLIHHLSYQEIAKHLDLSLSAVKCLVHRAKATLLKKLSDEDRDGGRLLLEGDGYEMMKV